MWGVSDTNRFQKSVSNEVCNILWDADKFVLRDENVGVNMYRKLLTNTSVFVFLCCWPNDHLCS